MAKGATKTKKAAEPEPETTEEVEGYSIEDKEPGLLHEKFAEWVKDEIGEDVDPRAVQLAWGLRNAFRKSEFYQTEVVEVRAKAKAERAKKKADEAEEQDGDEAPAKTTRKRGKAKATAQEAIADAEKPAATKTTTRKAGSKGKSAPF